ncbi:MULTISPECIES: response regulator [unclassified Duganella]|uniref:hybrid sensor histidine kinase/response regulator n=1 Tax=unclassified Duganella TaxID=2636909 RepID=UPI0008812708|nr:MULTISPECIES: response regulator [unclassified Duganella]SDG40675.1 PAS domain S-box-containing protein [Duganella sp. OV458]SDJ63250.1 PAS domain S-box-containing protein [Duganella sp. OV510]
MDNRSILILNVDDNDGARYVKTRILQSAGFQVVEAANGTDALEMARLRLPALVLLDVKLPDISGIEVCRRIKADITTCTVLVLQTSAALIGRDDKIRGLDGGADNYLAAPIEADELIANVNALLRLQRVQMDLRNSEERFRQLTENIDDVFWMFRLQDDQLLYASPAYERMFGRPLAQLEHSSDDWLNAVHAEDRETVTARWRSLSSDGQYDQEYRLTPRDGALRWVRDRAFLVRDDQQQPYRIARISSDISERKNMEGLLRAADENKNDFLATLAHELRNPLSPIRNAVALMNNAPPEQTETHRHARDVILRQVGHLTHLVDDLLDVARISEGKLTLRLQDVELHAVVEPALETVRALIEQRGHTLTVVVPPQQVWLHGDPVRLAQIIGNLLHNAAKFTDPGGQIRLDVTLPQPDRIRIAVSDNGIGITSYNLERIFDMFTQGASTQDRVHDGLGIGLSLVSKLMEMHGGTVAAHSEGIGKGSTFVLELSLPAPVAVDAPPAAAAPAAATALAPGKQRLLLVDDNIDSLSVMADLLTLMGHEVYTASNAAQALAQARAQQPQAIIMDLGMPDVDGYALARQLRADPAFAGVRLIAHTGYGAERDRERTREAGFDFHLVKPASFDELEGALVAA